MNKGVIKFFNNNPGKTYGFITSEGKDYFFFITDFRSEGVPVKGASVTFDTIETKKGMAARNIKLV